MFASFIDIIVLVVRILYDIKAIVVVFAEHCSTAHGACPSHPRAGQLAQLQRRVCIRHHIKAKWSSGQACAATDGSRTNLGGAIAMGVDI